MVRLSKKDGTDVHVYTDVQVHEIRLPNSLYSVMVFLDIYRSVIHITQYSIWKKTIPHRDNVCAYVNTQKD